MKTLYAIASAAVLTLSLAGTAGAVDIHDPSVGDNMKNVMLTITENGQSRQIILMSGETMYDVCQECTIRPEGGKEVHASQNDMVEIRGASAQVFKFPKTGTQQAQRIVKDTSPTVSGVNAGALAAPEVGPEGSAD